jgi:branched-chain amino acid transport system substrate-binding protein
MYKLLTIISILLILFGIIFFLSQENNVSKSDTVKTVLIGAGLHLSGELAYASEAFRDGILLAQHELNQKTTETGVHVDIIVEDDELDVSKMLSIARKFADVDQVDAVIVPAYLQAQTAGHVYEQAKIPTVVLWDSNPEIDAMGEYIFSIGPWTPSSGEKAAKYAYNTLGMRTASIVLTNEPYSLDLSRVFREEFEMLGGTVLEEVSINLGQGRDFRSQILRATQGNPDVLYTPITEGAPAFYRQLHEMRYEGQVVTSDILTEQMLAETKEATEGVYQTSIADPEGVQTEHMRKLYRDFYGKEIGNTLFVAWGYDAVHMLVAAAKKTGSGEDINDALYTLENFPGASATISITEGGSSPMLASMFVVQDETFLLVEE